MSESCIIIRDDDKNYRLVITNRDWGLLWGPFFTEGPVFSSAFGVYDNHTVAGGIPRTAEYIDMRVVCSIETNDCGTLQVYRRKAKMNWVETLPPLLEFLKNCKFKELIVEHYDRVR